MKYNVTFIAYYPYYDIEANNEHDAMLIAQTQFNQDTDYSSGYDDVEIEEAKSE